MKLACLSIYPILKGQIAAKKTMTHLLNSDVVNSVQCSIGDSIAPYDDWHFSKGDKLPACRSWSEEAFLAAENQCLGEGKVYNREATFIKPLMAEQQMHRGWQESNPCRP